jgi:hypothetical protein
MIQKISTTARKSPATTLAEQSQHAARTAAHDSNRLRSELAKCRAEFDECRDQLTAERKRYVGQSVGAGGADVFPIE